MKKYFCKCGKRIKGRIGQSLCEACLLKEYNLRKQKHMELKNQVETPEEPEEDEEEEKVDKDEGV